MRTKSLCSPGLVLLAVAGLTAVLVPGFASGGEQQPRAVTIMTQNLYIGTDLTPIFAATTVPDLIGAATAGFARVQATNFAERAVALAKEVETARPTLIALQEVSLFRTRPAAAPSPATTVVIDFLQLLLDALAARGLQYGVVAEVKNFDGEVPAFLPGITGLGFVRVTDRDVILARTDLNRGHLFLSNVQSSNFANYLTVTAAGAPLNLLRGWASVDVTVKGKTFRFLTTHLEPLYPPIQVIQANELLAGPGDTDLPLVFAGDFNTNADALPGPEPTYGNLIAAGFVDAWSQIDPLDPGYTCCEAADLLNATSSLDTRIDLVLLRDGFGGGNRSIAADAAEVVGEEPEDKTPSGLWPSDHAGVVVKFHLGNPGKDP